VGRRFHGGDSRCFPKPIPGKVSPKSVLFDYVKAHKRFTKVCFRSQTCPLDLYTDCFYERRKDAIATRVQLLREASKETLCDMLEDVWSSQEGKVCSLVNWERFSSLQQAQVFTVNLKREYSLLTNLMCSPYYVQM